MILYAVGALAQAVVGPAAEHRDAWLFLEELVGNLSELKGDEAANGLQWTYCTTSYNPVEPWGRDGNPSHRNNTLLPQLVWVDVPVNFTDAAVRLNCSSAAAARELPPPELAALLRRRLRPAAAGQADLTARAGGSECTVSKAALSAAFSAVLNSSNALCNDLSAGAPGLVGSAAVLQAFRSAEPPRGTLHGLRAMLSNSKKEVFRARATGLWDALMEFKDGDLASSE